MSFFNFQLIFFTIIINIYLKHNASHDFFFSKKKNMNKKLGFCLKICVYSFLVLMVIVFSNIFYCFFFNSMSYTINKKIIFFYLRKKNT